MGPVNCILSRDLYVPDETDTIGTCIHNRIANIPVNVKANKTDRTRLGLVVPGLGQVKARYNVSQGLFCTMCYGRALMEEGEKLRDIIDM